MTKYQWCKIQFDGVRKMNIELVLMSDVDIIEFKKNIQYAFQKLFENVFVKC